MLWHTGPLTPLGSLGGMLGGTDAAGKPSVVVSACWLETQALGASREVGGILAVGTASQVVLVAVTVR